MLNTRPDDRDEEEKPDENKDILFDGFVNVNEIVEQRRNLRNASLDSFKEIDNNSPDSSAKDQL